MPLPIADVFAGLPDPRSSINRRHHLIDVLTIALCAVISGADGWEDIAEYGRSKKGFFRQFLALPNGIPSHDTFWTDVAAVILIGRGRSIGDTSTWTGHYYIASHPGTAEELGGFARSHWQIENGLHWVLIVAFREDESRTRDAKAGANLALLRRVAVSLLKRADAKGSIHTRRLKAAWDDAFLQRVLQGVPATSGSA